MAIQHYSGLLGDFDYDDLSFSLTKTDDGTSYLKYIGDDVDGSNITIPEGIKNTSLMFASSNIEIPPKIPDGVENSDSMYLGCDKLKQPGSLPSTLKYADSMYSYCTSLKSAPYMPSSVISANFMYDGCANMTVLPNLSHRLERANGMCANCSSLISIPDLPDGLQQADCICLNCTKLQYPPVIPTSVKNINCGFSGCENLMKQPILSENITEKDDVTDGCYWADVDDDFEELSLDDNAKFETPSFCKSLENFYDKQKGLPSKPFSAMQFMRDNSLQSDIDNDLSVDVNDSQFDTNI